MQIHNTGSLYRYLLPGIIWKIDILGDTYHIHDWEFILVLICLSWHLLSESRPA